MVKRIGTKKILKLFKVYTPRTLYVMFVIYSMAIDPVQAADYEIQSQHSLTKKIIKWLIYWVSSQKVTQLTIKARNKLEYEAKKGFSKGEKCVLIYLGFVLFFACEALLAKLRKKDPNYYK